MKPGPPLRSMKKAATGVSGGMRRPSGWMGVGREGAVGGDVSPRQAATTAQVARSGDWAVRRASLEKLSARDARTVPETPSCRPLIAANQQNNSTHRTVGVEQAGRVRARDVARLDLEMGVYSRPRVRAWAVWIA